MIGSRRDAGAPGKEKRALVGRVFVVESGGGLVAVFAWHFVGDVAGVFLLFFVVEGVGVLGGAVLGAGAFALDDGGGLQ